MAEGKNEVLEAEHRGGKAELSGKGPARFVAIFSALFISMGVLLILMLWPARVYNPGREYVVFLLGGIVMFPGVVILIGFLIFKADEIVRRKESRVPNLIPEGESSSAIALGERRRIGSCVICHQDLYEDDSVASCPHCKRIAHRGDLLEWIHVKGTCPACGRHLDENQVQGVGSE